MHLLLNIGSLFKFKFLRRQSGRSPPFSLKLCVHRGKLVDERRRNFMQTKNVNMPLPSRNGSFQKFPFFVIKMLYTFLLHYTSSNVYSLDVLVRPLDNIHIELHDTDF